MVKLHIGIDDTDSPRMGCTTYVAALIVQRLRELNVPFVDYPNLIRLNPNVPWKTRGNGALCLRVRCPENLVEQIKEIVIETVEENADLSFKGTDPGIVLLPQEVPPEVQIFARNAIQGLVKNGYGVMFDQAIRCRSCRPQEGTWYRGRACGHW